jgi:SRSO17 transposase
VTHSTPFVSTLAEIRDSLLIERVQTPERDLLWNQLMNRFHYLGYRKGASLKYLVWCSDRVVAAFGWGNCALSVSARDTFVSPDLCPGGGYGRIVNQVRFLILPGIAVPFLASHLLSRQVPLVVRDWTAATGIVPRVFETFVDPERFSGTSYRAANWIYVGRSKGFQRARPFARHHGKPKEVYLYPLDPLIRSRLQQIRLFDLRQVPQSPWHDEEAPVLATDLDWDPHLFESIRLRPRDCAKLERHLMVYYNTFRSFFDRIGSFFCGGKLLVGLLSDMERKSLEPIALRTLGPGRVRAFQNLYSGHHIDFRGIRDQLSGMIKKLIEDEADGMHTLDSSEFPKKGSHSAGVARQYCGNLGKVENCQSGVFIGYTSHKGYALTDAELFLPEKWFEEAYAERRRKTRIPETCSHRSKRSLALALLERQIPNLRGRWVGMDSGFGCDPGFLARVADLGCWYVADVPANTLVVDCAAQGGQLGQLRWEPKPRTAREMVQARENEIEEQILGPGTKGPVVAAFACWRVKRVTGGEEGASEWLIARKREDGSWKYSLSNAPADIDLARLKTASTRRWSIEQCFEEAKSYLGMGDYETRSLVGWHRHMTFVMMALIFLLVVRIRFKKKSQG